MISIDKIYILETQREYDTPTIIGWTDSREKAEKWVSAFPEELEAAAKAWDEYDRKLTLYTAQNPEPQPESHFKYAIDPLSYPEHTKAIDEWYMKCEEAIGMCPAQPHQIEPRYFCEISFVDLGE